MNARPRMKILALSIGLALSQLAAEAMADSAVGVDTVMGNAANPNGVNPVALRADGAIDPDVALPKRTPSGQLYNMPYASSDVKAGGDVRGSIEMGATKTFGDKDAALRSMYRDTKTGTGGVSSFGLNVDNADASFLELSGGNPGSHDQFMSVQVGKYNDWRTKLFYSETKHVFTTNWKTLFSGEGTGNLTTGLPVPVMVKAGTFTTGTAGYVGATSTCSATVPCWSYNGTVYSNATAVAAINGLGGTYNSAGTLIAGSGQSNQAADIYTRLSATMPSELSLVRAKGGVRFDKSLDTGLKVYASYSNEQRNGARPLAMNESNFSTEIAEPINYTTHDWLAGLSYTEGLNRANLNLSVTNFRNNIKGLDVQYPMLQASSVMGVISTATFALAPDNDALNLKGEFARDLPDFYKGKFTAAASYGSNRQDDKLMMPISLAQSAELAGATNTISNGTAAAGIANPGYTTDALVNNWNGVNGNPLSRATSGQRIDNKLLNLGLSIKPTDNLGLKAGLRMFDTDNKGGYVAYNPLTGQFGRGFTDNQGVARLEVVTAGTTQGGACYTQPGYAAVAGCVFNPGAYTGATTTNAKTGFVNTALGNNSPVFNPARSTKQNNLNLAADYSINSTSTATGEFDREEFKRDYRERDKTTENKFKFGYVNRALTDNSTLRVSFENDHKTGSAYNYRSFYLFGQGLPGLDMASIIANSADTQIAGGVTGGTTIYGFSKLSAAGASTAYLAGLLTQQSSYFRKMDEADRNQNIVNARLNVAATENLDVGAFVQVKQTKYPNSTYGVQSNDQNSLSVDVNYQASVTQTFTGYVSYQQADRKLNGNTGVGGVASCTVAQATYGLASGDWSACSDSSRPASANWSNDTKDTNSVIGATFQNDFGTARLIVDYSFSTSKTSTTNTYGSTALNATASGTATSQATQASIIAANAMPDMTFKQHDLNLSLLVPVSKKTTVRISDSYTVGHVTDWHYDGVIHNAAAAFDSGTILQDGGAQNFHANMVGVFLNYKL